VAAGAVGIGTAGGVACAVAAVGWTVADLFAIEPRLAKSGGSTDDASTKFLEKALRATTIDDVARELAVALRDGLPPTGAPAAILLAPGADGQVRTIALAGVVPPLGDAAAALDWLGAIGEPLDRAMIANLFDAPVVEGGGDGARAAAGLLDAAHCDVVLPLRHRGLLLGVVLVARPPGTATDPATTRVLRALRAYATAAIARTMLGHEVKQRGKLSKTVNLATAMQEAMMPVERPVRRPGFELRGMFRPVEDCGGDLWMWRELGDGRILLLIADATGHGAAPALLAAVAKGTVDALCQLGGSEIDPATLLSQLARVVYRAGKRRYLMTAFAAVVDVPSRSMKFANAGQNFPYHIRAGKDGAPPVIEALVARGDTLGSAPRTKYETHERALGIGDRLVLYTDGIIDAGTPYRDAFGEKRLRAALVSMAGERSTKVPELVFAQLEEHVQGGGGLMGDDVTLLMFELTDPGGSAGG
jgi:serine phosphatase RsbU (regulator of sigma subunit)